jgi:hypothetical protein
VIDIASNNLINPQSDDGVKKQNEIFLQGGNTNQKNRKSYMSRLGIGKHAFFIISIVKVSKLPDQVR